ncbi:hypothetical protein IE53DRAFT_324437 [Violaceomyces palustris]|uniref:Uncharacterized protein n=1 Tax=Violaceomyces palustris TaxID=1673888 RepID=A0ACD0P6L8_9BASI|nr:hypothetical protein IE53DRAFT_324437 [Violaceomyces palustris]
MGSCAPIREDLAACIVKTDCFLVDKRTAQDCLTNHMAELPTECQHLYKSYVECRRAMVSQSLEGREESGGGGNGERKHASRCSSVIASNCALFSLLLQLVGTPKKLDMRKRFRGNKASASSSNNPPGGTTAVESSISSSETSSST